MAVLTGAAFISKWNARFANNTTRQIDEADMREFVEDIKDSFQNISGATTVESWKSPCQVATTANITLSGEQTIDGVLTSASRVLVKNQTTTSQNGIYVSAAGAWARSTDADAGSELEGAAVGVTQGTTQQNTVWLQTTDNVTLGTSAIAWQQIGFGGGTQTLTSVLTTGNDGGALQIKNIADPTAAQDAATKTWTETQINNNLAGLNWKQSVKAATTANITLSGAQTIDGISLVAADRCLVKNQSTASQNGIYVVASGAWTRATDNDSTAEMQNAVVSVDQGTANADTSWRQSADSVTVGSSNVTWVSFGASGISNSAANNELMKSNGTNAVASGLFSTAAGDVAMGTGLSGSVRTVTAEGSATDVGLEFVAKGDSIIRLRAGNGMELFPNYNSVSSPEPVNIIVRKDITNSVFNVLTLTTETNTTGANGIGTGINFACENVASVIKTGATIEAIVTNANSSAESFDLVFKTMAAGATAAERLRITSDGRLYGKALHNNSGAITGTANQYIASGTYTPTLTNHTNVSSSTAVVCQYMRVGNVVTVSGNVDVTATAAAATSTILQLSLPVASNFANDYNCGGTGVQVAGTTVCAINGNVTDDRAQLVWLSGTTSSITIHFSFTYLIL